MNIDWSKAPEGATHYLKDSPQPWRDLSGDNWLWFWQGQWHGEGEKSILNNTSEQLIRSQGNQLVRRPKVLPAWTGEGLPPVGSHAHVYDPEGLLVYGAGEDGEVIAHVENTAVIRMSYGLGCFTAKHLRTAEQIATEERKAEISELEDLILHHWESDNVRDLATTIYDAKYRKQEQK